MFTYQASSRVTYTQSCHPFPPPVMGDCRGLRHGRPGLSQSEVVSVRGPETKGSNKSGRGSRLDKQGNSV